MIDISKIIKDEEYTFVAPCYPGQTAYLIREAGKKNPWLKNIKIEETKIEQLIFTEKGIKVKFTCNSAYQTSIESLGKTWFLDLIEANKIFDETKKKAC